MMELNEIFYKNLPSLDLHGLDRDTARIYINDFIKDNYKMKCEYFIIIHGIGSGILKDITRKTLEKNKLVADFKVCYNNVGSTIVKIKL